MKTFEDIPLEENLRRAIADLGFEKPTPIQQKVIPIALEGKDVMACSETGSGKTAAFGIPLVNQLTQSKSNALILAPTRELVHQISDFLRELTIHLEHFRVTSIVGGADMRKQVNAIKKRPRILVATPGRLIDHLKRKSIKLDAFSILVLDEGDRMLDMGFAPQLNIILEYLPQKRQTSLFTATLPGSVQSLAKSYLNKPEIIKVGQVSQPVATIKQSVLQVSSRDKYDVVIDELNARKGAVIIFAQTKRRVDALSKHLESYGFDLETIHGDRTQGQRNRAIQNFKTGKCRILCATDIAARGIDIPHVEHIINFDLPSTSEDYVHRIGRTARAGATGEAITFVTPGEHREWQALAYANKIKGVELDDGMKKPVGLSAGRSKRRGRGPFVPITTKPKNSSSKRRSSKPNASPSKKKSTKKNARTKPGSNQGFSKPKSHKNKSTTGRRKRRPS